MPILKKPFLVFSLLLAFSGLNAQLIIKFDSSTKFYGLIDTITEEWKTLPTYSWLSKKGSVYMGFRKSELKAPFFLLNDKGEIIDKYGALRDFYGSNRQVFFVGSAGKIKRQKINYWNYNSSVIYWTGAQSTLLDSTGRILGNFEADLIEIFSRDSFLVLKRILKDRKSIAEKYGLLKYDGTINIPCEYDLIYKPRCHYEKNVWLINKGGLWRKYNDYRKGEDIYGGKWGILIPETNVFVEPRYTSIKVTAYPDLFKVNVQGVESSESSFEYQIHAGCNGGYYRGVKGGLWGYLNKYGEEIIKPEFTYITERPWLPIAPDFFIATKDSFAYDFYQGLPVGPRYALINSRGEQQTEFIYSNIWHNWVDTFLLASKNPIYTDSLRLAAKWGFMNSKGRELMLFVHDSIRYTNNLIFYKFQDHGSWGLINHNMTYLTDTIYPEILFFSDSNYAFKNKAGLYALTDNKGIPLTEFKFSDINSRGFGYNISSFTVWMKDSCNIIWKDGKEVSFWKKDAGCKCDFAEFVKKDEHWNIRTTWRVTYPDSIVFFERLKAADKYQPLRGQCMGWYIVNVGGQLSGDSVIGGKWGIVELDGGTYIIPPKADRLEFRIGKELQIDYYIGIAKTTVILKSNGMWTIKHKQ